MAEFQITETKRSLPETGTGITRYPRPYMGTGEGAIYQAMGNLGAVAGNFGEQLYKKQGIAEVTEKLSEANETYLEMRKRLATETDPGKYWEEFEAVSNQLASVEIKNGWAKQQYKPAFASLKKSIGLNILGDYERQVDENYRLAIANREALAIKSGSTAGLETFLKKEVSEGRMLDKEAETRLLLVSEKAEQERISNQLKDIQTRIGLNPSAMYTEISNALAKGKTLPYAPDVKADRLFALQDRARAVRGQTSTLKNIAYRANLIKQSNDMVEAYSSGEIYDEPDILEDAQPIQQNFLNRVANNTLDVGDNITYESMLAQIENYGEHYDPLEMASAYASGLSTQQYKELERKNRQNAELTNSQKENLRGYSEFVQTKYNELSGMIMAKLPPNAIPQMRAAMYQDQLNVVKKIRQAVIDGEPPEDIFTMMEKSFIRETEKYLKSGWGLWLNSRADELKESVQALEGRNERYEVIMDLIKSSDKADKERLRHLMIQWYGD